MGKTKDLGHLAHVIVYDASNNITLPANLTVTGTITGYATTASLSSYVPTSRTITINGTSFDLSADRSWTITAGIASVSGTSPINVSTTSGAATVSISQANTSTNGFLSSTDWNTFNGKQNALTIGNIVSNDTSLITVTGGTGAIIGSGVSLLVIPSAIVASGISSTLVTTALGYTPVTNARTITINNTTFDLSANRSWTVTATETDTLATVTGRGANTSTQVVFSGGMAAWNATTPGLSVGTIQIGAANGNANFGGAITFAARDGGGGSNAQAGIYVVSDGAYGTRMYFATTDAYVTGSKTAMSISETGVVSITKGAFNAISATFSSNVTTGLLIAQGPGGNYNENVRLPGSTAVISFNTSGTAGAGSYNIVSQTNFQIRNAGGTQVFILDQSGNLTMSGTVTAPTFSGALSGNATTATAAAGATFLTQANATWGARLQIGGNGDPGIVVNTAVVQATDGNLHMDSGTGKGMYLNYYRNGTIYLNGSTYFINSTGSQYNGNAATATNATNAGNSSTTSQREFSYLRINSNEDLYLDYNYGCSIVGVYSSYRYQGVFSMGNSYKLSRDGTTPGNLYGISWSHPNAGGQAGYLNDHGMMVMVNGVTYAAISSNIWARGTITANGSAFANGNRLVENTGTWSINVSGSSGSVSGVTESQIVYGGAGRASTSASNMNDTNQKSGLYYYYDPSGRPYQEWWNWITIAGNAWQSSNNYSFQLAHCFHDDGFYVRRMTNGSAASWRQIMDSGNIGSQSVSYATTSGNLSGFDKVNPSFGAVYADNWFRNYGDTGLYNQTYAAHFRRNVSSSYGTWEVFGYNKGGYAGINLIDTAGYWSNLMFENGSGGIYQQNGQSWLLYFFYGNDCLGLSGSDTYDWVRVCSNGKHRITNDSWCDATSWAYTFSNISDGRLKENIVTVDSALDKVLQLRGVYYNWIIDTENKKHIGLIAQETAAVCPEVVNYHDETDTYSVNYSELSGLFVESTKELNQKLIDANARIELLETKLNQLLNA